MMALISSSLTKSFWVLLIPNSNKMRSLDADNNQIKGLKMIKVNRMIGVITNAIVSGNISPMRLGNNSPISIEKNVIIITTKVIEIELAYGANGSMRIIISLSGSVMLSPEYKPVKMLTSVIPV